VRLKSPASGRLARFASSLIRFIRSEVVGCVKANYNIDDRWAVTLNGSASFVEKNDETRITTIPLKISSSRAKTKHTVGLSVTYAISQTASIELRSGYSWIYRDPSGYLPVAAPPPAIGKDRRS
jgi:hypothetical protein